MGGGSQLSALLHLNVQFPKRLHIFNQHVVSFGQPVVLTIQLLDLLVFALVLLRQLSEVDAKFGQL